MRSIIISELFLINPGVSALLFDYLLLKFLSELVLSRELKGIYLKLETFLSLFELKVVRNSLIYPESLFTCTSTGSCNISGFT